MKEEILKRAMFDMPLSKEAKNSGIMSGFEDDINEMDDEDEMPIMERTPQNPEILMNTLRGDMRSVDARYMELAQMVGEEAAMETPPEVLAMLQEHFTMMQQPQGGIGGLPQGAGMMPPPMPGQDPMAMQGAPMPMDQGPMMPPGGEGMAGPFPQGGAEQAPPTPDGMPPQQFNIGGPVSAMGTAFMTQAGRFAPAVARTLNQVGPTASRYAQSANAALGRMFMNPQMSQPYLENVRGAGGRFTADQIARGGNLMQPTFTQGLSQGLNQLSQRYPNAAPVLSSAAAMLAGLDTDIQKEPQPGERKVIGYEVPMMAPATGAGGGRGFIDERYYAQDPTMSREAAMAAAEEKTRGMPAEQTPSVDFPVAANPDEDSTFASSAAEDLAKATGTAVPVKAKSKIDRIREARDEYSPLFRELMGDSKEDMKTNALLMLADAGFKFAGATEPTMAMSLAKAAEGIPKGFAALVAQAKDRQLKLDSAALSQAITDVNAQDAAAKALQLKILDNDYKLLIAQAKAKGKVKVSSIGMGGRIIEDTDGTPTFSIETDPAKDPTVSTALNSPYTLRPTDNPFVENLGEAPTTVETDKDERIKLGSALRSLDNALQEVNTLKRNFTELYSPGTWFTSKVNNLLVPIGGGVIRPDVDQKKAATTVGISLNRIMKAAASANESGRIAVQEQEWERETQEALTKPEEFFKNKELTAGSINALEARFRNARQQILTQLGFEKNNYVMNTPNTGTQSDPFVVSQDPDAARRMYTFLKSTVGTAQDPNATVYLKMPNGSIQAFTVGQLRSISLK